MEDLKLGVVMEQEHLSEEELRKTHFLDRTGWASGPWDNEPDRLQWVTHVGYHGLIVRNQQGSLCGYLGVPPGHQWHGKRYDEIAASVHGGLTYAGKCAYRICHIPAPGETDDVWWVGFDCAHFQDISPGLDATMRKVWEMAGKGERPPRPDLGFVSYKDLNYVISEVENLAAQAAEPELPTAA